MKFFQILKIVLDTVRGREATSVFLSRLQVLLILYFHLLVHDDYSLRDITCAPWLIYPLHLKIYLKSQMRYDFFQMLNSELPPYK